MKKATFPKRNEDGSFCVEVCLIVTGNNVEDLAPRMQRWINDIWMPRNTTWKWVGSSGRAMGNKETLNYDDEFSRPPQIVSCKNSELRFRLFGKQSAKYWRDWLVLKLTPELKAEFPDIGIAEPRSIKDCTE